MTPRDLTVILLSVYDGERFLPEQLESLERQDDPRWMLLWRDDGSRDGSVDIMARFAARLGTERVRRLEAPAGQLGVAGSFLALLRAAPADAARYAFCDQDDVWLPGKLGRAAAALAAMPQAAPALYCARQTFVDRQLRPLGLSADVARAPTLGNALVQNVATGCTVALNGAAREAVLTVPPPAGTLHDWWAYLVVTATGGAVEFDPMPVILYRQHGGNAVGGNASKLVRALRAFRRGPDPFLRGLAGNIGALAAHPALTPQSRDTLAGLGALRVANPFGRLRALRRAGLGRQGLREDVLLRLWVLLRALPEEGA